MIFEFASDWNLLLIHGIMHGRNSSFVCALEKKKMNVAFFGSWALSLDSSLKVTVGSHNMSRILVKRFEAYFPFSGSYKVKLDLGSGEILGSLPSVPLPFS
jgi:hypothetical protein